jgi:hypothetical protein
LNSDANVTNTLELVTTVLEEPACHSRLIGNSNVSLRELEYLKSQWVRREALMATRHPVVLSDSSSTVRTLPEDKCSRNAGFFMHVNRPTSKCSGKF